LYNEENDDSNGFMIEIPHYSKPFIVDGKKVFADNSFDAATTNVSEGQIAGRVDGDLWAGFVRRGADLVQVGAPFKVFQLKPARH
jgi:hypothetical protein